MKKDKKNDLWTKKVQVKKNTYSERLFWRNCKEIRRSRVKRSISIGLGEQYIEDEVFNFSNEFWNQMSKTILELFSNENFLIIKLLVNIENIEAEHILNFSFSSCLKGKKIFHLLKNDADKYGKLFLFPLREDNLLVLKNYMPDSIFEDLVSKTTIKKAFLDLKEIDVNIVKERFPLTVKNFKLRGYF